MKILIHFTHTPYGSDASRELLDMALAHATFGHQVSLVFSGEGIFNLLPDQLAKPAGRKEFTRLFKGLDLYDIEKLYVVNDDLDALNLKQDQLIDGIEPIKLGSLGALFAANNQVISL
ncbi:sulfurtransferase complex subunit TusC [Pleionea litopenaei]|uniref:Sulfurtransferase complex subunit TusC n=1 Tax=Pleionea litopenaei TaxID=3070815 RepID=A0AA51RUV0_9GAMM|nr:sulfurtransferase complex subunit TusC [Pleionea sp. HL-JVS1]WMS88083.1 sulfurtransferase complex subunit TusC [Pleionea sp. HL-JVS1]